MPLWTSPSLPCALRYDGLRDQDGGHTPPRSPAPRMTGARTSRSSRRAPHQLLNVNDLEGNTPHRKMAAVGVAEVVPPAATLWTADAHHTQRPQQRVLGHPSGERLGLLLAEQLRATQVAVCLECLDNRRGQVHRSFPSTLGQPHHAANWTGVNSRLVPAEPTQGWPDRSAFGCSLPSLVPMTQKCWRVAWASPNRSPP